MRLLLACLVFIGCSRAATPTLSNLPDNAIQEENGHIEIETTIRDTIYKSDSIFIYEIMPAETIYVAKKIKIKKSNNTDNSEMIKLKNAVLIRDSQIDSLNILLGKKCVGEQTNNGLAWWILILIGMALGITGYQAIRLGITKKW